MGKVYPWTDVQAGRVPVLSDFPVIIERIHEKFQSDVICGGLIMGSVLRGDHTRRSDLDCVVIYQTKQEREALAILHALHREARARFVPLGFVPCDLRTSMSRFHHLGPAFLVHLEAAVEAGGVIKENPLWYINRASSDMRPEIESYIRMKLYKLQEGATEYVAMGPERRAEFLRKALEAPLHVARKALQLVDRCFRDDSKMAIIAAYNVQHPVMNEQLMELVELDRSYTRELERQLVVPDEERYRQTITTIEVAIPKVIDFVRWNLLRLSGAHE